MISTKKITYLDQITAQKVDEELMSEYGFSLDILMELAGQSIAHTTYEINKKYINGKLAKILIIAGPGNNGGDGIVAARHLKMLGFQPTLLVVKKPEKQFFKNLLRTCEYNEIKIIEYSEVDTELKSNNISFGNFMEKNKYELVIDSIFGFSFKPPIRPPYDYIINELITTKIPVFSIDIPSGWDVEKGNVNNTFTPQYLISLTLPKIGTEKFEGVHYLGGRFVPKKMIEKFGWNLPDYKETNQFLEL